MNDNFTSMYYTDFKIVSAELTKAGQIEIVKRYLTNATYACIGCGAVPDRVIKEIYGGAIDGTIKLIKTVEGTHTPSYNVAESIEFPEEE